MRGSDDLLPEPQPRPCGLGRRAFLFCPFGLSGGRSDARVFNGVAGGPATNPPAAPRCWKLPAHVRSNLLSVGLGVIQILVQTILSEASHRVAKGLALFFGIAILPAETYYIVL